MASALLLLVPLLALKSPWPPPTRDPVVAPSVAVEHNVAPAVRAAIGYSWNVDLYDGGVLRVEAPVAVVETVLPLPIRLSTVGARAVTVEVCESWECLLPRAVRVAPGDVVTVDALFSGRAPRLRIDHDRDAERSCCDRALANGRAVAFAGGDEHAFAFASHSGEGLGLYGTGLLTVDVGTYFAERPDLLAGFGAVIVDDGWAPPGLAGPLRRFVKDGGLLSMRRADALALGLVDVDTPTVAMAMADLPESPAYGSGAARLDGNRVALRLDDRVVQLDAAFDRTVRVGAGRLILRDTGRAEDQRLAQLVLVVPGFHGRNVQLEPRSVPVVNVAAAGLVSSGFGLVGFFVAACFIAAIGVVLWRSLQREREKTSSRGSPSRRGRGPVVAARRTVVVGVAGAAALLGLRVFCTADAEVTLAHWGPGDGSRRVVNAYARAPGSFGDVDLGGAPWKTPPTIVTLVGRSSHRNTVSAEGGRVHAALSSSSGLVGVWFDNDATPGALRETREGRFENALPFALDWVLLREDLNRFYVVADVAPGASFSMADARALESFGTVLEERLLRDVLTRSFSPSNSGGSPGVVGLATVDGVLTAIEVTR